MKIFITGITGFVGASAANHFVSSGHSVQGIGRKPVLPPWVSDACNYKPVDIKYPMEDIDADIVIHAAALASDTASFDEAYQVNVKGTENVLRAARQVNHFINISSSSVYHYRKGRGMFETDSGVDFDCLSPYGQSKWLAEELVRGNRGNFKKTIFRPRAIYGKYDQLLLPRLLKLVKGDKIILPAHLTKQISLTHISNLILAIELCLHKQLAESAVFNVADPESYDLNEVLPTLLSAVMAKSMQNLKIPAWLFELFIKVNKRLKLNSALNPLAVSSLTQAGIINIYKITESLGYAPVKNFFNSYSEIADWIHKEQGWKFFFKKDPGPKNLKLIL
jgi:nucleoside-diphosphate-sugar epimerase